MFKGFQFKVGNSKNNCCSITIEEVKNENEQLKETSECCEDQKSCCS